MNFTGEYQLIFSHHDINYFYDFSVHNNHLFIGGLFNTEIANNSYNCLLHYQILGDGLNNGKFLPISGVTSPPRGYVQILSESEGTLFIGGYYTRYKKIKK